MLAPLASAMFFPSTAGFFLFHQFVADSSKALCSQLMPTLIPLMPRKSASDALCLFPASVSYVLYFLSLFMWLYSHGFVFSPFLD